MRSGVFNTALPAGFEDGLSYTLDSVNENGTLVRDLYGKKKVNTTQTIVESGAVLHRSESETYLVEEGQIYKTTEFMVEADDGTGKRFRSSPGE